MEENGTYRWTPPGEPKDPKMPREFKTPNLPKLKPAAIIAIAIVLVLALGAASSFYTVDDKQQAVVTTFGKVTAITDAGVTSSCPSASSRWKRWTSTSTSTSSWATAPTPARRSPRKAP